MPNFETLWEQSSSKLRTLAGNLTSNREDAEDLVSEACLKCCKKFDTFQNERPFMNWAARIMTRVYFDSRRTAKRRPTTISVYGAKYEVPGREAIPHYTPEDVFGPAKDLLEDVEGMADIEALGKEIMARLGDSNVVPVMQLAIQGFSMDEIAAKLGIPRGTARTRLHRARSRIQDLMPSKLDAEEKDTQ